MPVAIEPLTSAVGAEVVGVDLTALQEDELAAIEKALHEHGVVVFRGQSLDDDQYKTLGERFGQIQEFPFSLPVRPDLPEVHMIDSVGNQRFTGVATWHSDATFMERPPKATMLRAVKLPPVGGDTLFANMHAAYEALSDPLRRMVDELTATHDPGRHIARAAAKIGRADIPYGPVSHPVVRTHPETGRRCLFVNRLFTSRINELTERESEVLLPLLCDHVTAPEFQCRFSWEPGSVAFWDNCTAQHYASTDFSGERVMHRIVLEGERPR